MTAPAQADVQQDPWMANLVRIHNLAADAISTNLTAPFPVISSRGNHYILVDHAHAPDVILVRPIKNHCKETLLDAHSEIVAYLTAHGARPASVRCDNKCSKELHAFFVDEQINLLLVPPYDHRTNPAKHATDIFKWHFLVAFSGAIF